MTDKLATPDFESVLNMARCGRDDEFVLARARTGEIGLFVKSSRLPNSKRLTAIASALRGLRHVTRGQPVAAEYPLLCNADGLFFVATLAPGDYQIREGCDGRGSLVWLDAEDFNYPPPKPGHEAEVHTFITQRRIVRHRPRCTRLAAK